MRGCLLRIRLSRSERRRAKDTGFMVHRDLRSCARDFRLGFVRCVRCMRICSARQDRRQAYPCSGRARRAAGLLGGWPQVSVLRSTPWHLPGLRRRNMALAREPRLRRVLNRHHDWFFGFGRSHVRVEGAGREACAVHRPARAVRTLGANPRQRRERRAVELIGARPFGEPENQAGCSHVRGSTMSARATNGTHPRHSTRGSGCRCRSFRYSQGRDALKRRHCRFDLGLLRRRQELLHDASPLVRAGVQPLAGQMEVPLPRCGEGKSVLTAFEPS